MSERIEVPSFGTILNAGIKTIKQLGNSRVTGINEKTFKQKLAENAGFSNEMIKMSYIEPLSSITDDMERYELIIDGFAELTITCLTAIGFIKDGFYPLLIHTKENFLDLVAFDEEVTPDNIIKIDPVGKIYFWLAGENYSIYKFLSDRSEDEALSNLGRMEQLSFLKIRTLNNACYGEDGDPLINYLMNETMRRTSVFMNNYADVELANDYIKVTPEKLIKAIHKLTPLQFEHLCIEVVKRSLESENPDATYETRHVGRTNDGGIDGMVIQTFPNGDKDTYYIQSKLYAPDKKIANNQLRDFVGGYPPDKQFHHGIFITTSDFTAPAIDYASTLPSHNLILINKIELLDQMLKHEVGIERFATEIMVMNKEFFRKLKKY